MGIPAVRCRVAQEVIRALIDPIFAPTLHDSSHGFRRPRSCHTAMAQLVALHRQGYRGVVDADRKGFFESIPHPLILALVAREMADGNILSLIKKFLQASVMEEGEVRPTRQGTPHGGVVSPRLANLVLHHLDWRLEALGYRFVRYADDFVVLCKTRRQAEKALQAVTQCVEDDLGLALNPEKTQLTTFGQGFVFLGDDGLGPHHPHGWQSGGTLQEEDQGVYQTQSYPRCRGGHAGQPGDPWDSPLLCHRLHLLPRAVQCTGPLDQDAHPVYEV